MTRGIIVDGELLKPQVTQRVIKGFADSKWQKYIRRMKRKSEGFPFGPEGRAATAIHIVRYFLKEIPHKRAPLLPFNTDQEALFARISDPA